jgi:hypothetical protein
MYELHSIAVVYGAGATPRATAEADGWSLTPDETLLGGLTPEQTHNCGLIGRLTKSIGLHLMECTLKGRPRHERPTVDIRSMILLRPSLRPKTPRQVVAGASHRLKGSPRKPHEDRASPAVLTANCEGYAWQPPRRLSLSLTERAF